jgi:Uma2 family endonuclease
LPRSPAVYDDRPGFLLEYRALDRTIESGMATNPKLSLTPKEYLASERLAQTRSEYYDGEVFAMAGASQKHNRIVINLVLSLGNGLRQRDCEVYASDMRLLVGDTGLYTYPDVMVVCGKPILADAHSDILTNPVLIVEVLSESTKDYDRGGKFHQYRRIPSLQEFLTVSQTEMLIDQSVRQADNSWVVRELTPANGNVPLRGLGIDLDFADVYNKVEFDKRAG